MTKEEAIEIVKEFINGTCLHLVDQEALETLIPELRESEDERIRKEMIEFLNQYKEDGLRGVDITPWISYLEKQKEQKPEIRVKIPKFRVGDIIQHIPLEKWDSSKKIVSIDEHGYNYNLSHLGDTVSGGAIGFAFENDYELVEQKPSEWSGPKEFISDTISERLKSLPLNLKKKNEDVVEPCECNDDVLDKQLQIWFEKGKCSGRDEILQQISKGWSKEDAKVLNDIVVFVSGYADKRVVSRWVEFLKSLRPKKNISYGELPLVSIDYMEGLDTDFEKQVGAVIASAMNREHQFTSKYIKWTAQRLMEYAKDKQNSEKESVSDNKEWSEEDEDFINMLILHFNYLINKGGDSVETYKSYREKLKSLLGHVGISS